MSFETQLAADLGAVFLNGGEFAKSASYTATGANAVTVKVIFDSPFELVDPASGVSFGAEDTSVHGKRSELGEAKLGETLVIDSVTYYVREVKPRLDSAGIVELKLSTQAQHG